VIDHVLRFTIPAAYSLLPVEMRSEKATAMLLTIALQESAFAERKQINGSARGFWQFELLGLKAVMRHPRTKPAADAVIDALCYRLPRHGPAQQATAVHDALADNDTLACGFARLLLWTLPVSLPGPDEAQRAWQQYLDAWRPGKPHPATWNHHYAEAWGRVQAAAGRELLDPE
jgi:hypothetical protein